MKRLEEFSADIVKFSDFVHCLIHYYILYIIVILSVIASVTL